MSLKIREGDKEFEFERGADGKMHIVSARGVKLKPGLLDRLRLASSSNCYFCMKAEMNDLLIKMMLMDLLGDELIDW